MSHPNRGRSPGLSANPKPAEILAARTAAGLTQTQAATLLHTTLRTWQQWEQGDRRMHPAFFELFMIKAPIAKVKKPMPRCRLCGLPTMHSGDVCFSCNQSGVKLTPAR